MTFAETFATGRATEGLIARWIMARGGILMPAYEIEMARGKGPQVFSKDAELVAPDFLVFGHKGIQWIEAKHKSVFTWHRGSQRWTTGIDIRHYGDYLRVAKATQLPVWLLFFHSNSTPSPADLRMGSASECPTGLFGGDLFDLVTAENHRAPKLDSARDGMKGHGNSGMVYWAYESLRRFASKQDVEKIANSCQTKPQET